jgi:hypothetical protein
MKRGRILEGLLLGLALLLATSAFASNSGSMQILDPVTVAGTQLSPGQYAVKWDGSGSNVQVSILKGSKVVATTPAHLIDLNQKSNGDVAVLKANTDGSKSLSEIHFSGKKSALALGDESNSMDSSSGTH